MSNPLDVFVPIDEDEFFFDDDDEVDEATRVYRLTLLRQIRRDRELLKRQRRRRMARRDSNSSESETEGKPSEINGKTMTPATTTDGAGGTPAEAATKEEEKLVKLDPAEIGKFYTAIQHTSNASFSSICHRP